MRSVRQGWLLLGLAGPALAAEPTPIVTVRAVHPDRELAAMLDLFRGAKASSPAAALAGWKRASREPDRLGKPAEALIAAFNPRMAGELGTLDDSRLSLWSDPESGRVSWNASIPRDDGTFAALATAMALSDGAAEAPIDGRPVDRLGGPGAPLMGRAARGVAVAANREGLAPLLRPDRPGDLGKPAIESGWIVRFDPGGLAGVRSLAAAQVAEACRASGCRAVTVVARMEGSAISAILSGDLDPAPADPPAIDPAWLDGVPAGRAMAAFALAIDPRPASWDAAFALADRVERVDPDRKDLAPLRIRLDLAARAAGLRTEADILPHLRGLSGWVGGGGQGADLGALAIHLDDEGSANRLVEKIKSKPGDGPARSIGSLAGRPLRLDVRGPSLLIGWGEGTIEATDEARARPDRSAGREIRRTWTGVPPARVVAAWPGRIPHLVPADSPLAQALLGAPPVILVGGREGNRTVDRLTWPDLDATVRRFLDLIPLDPPPDR